MIDILTTPSSLFERLFECSQGSSRKAKNLCATEALFLLWGGARSLHPPWGHALPRLLGSGSGRRFGGGSGGGGGALFFLFPFLWVFERKRKSVFFLFAK